MSYRRRPVSRATLGPGPRRDDKQCGAEVPRNWEVVFGRVHNFPSSKVPLHAFGGPEIKFFCPATARRRLPNGSGAMPPDEKPSFCVELARFLRAALRTGCGDGRSQPTSACSYWMAHLLFRSGQRPPLDRAAPAEITTMATRSVLLGPSGSTRPSGANLTSGIRPPIAEIASLRSQ